jgi:hypothetical protein
MYVNPFWLGVLVTILVEVVIVILGAIITAHCDSDEGGGNGNTPKNP